MNDVLMVSAPHTGTMFWKRFILSCHGMGQSILLGRDESSDPARGRTLWYGHPYPRNIAQLSLILDYGVRPLVPLRDPLQSLISSYHHTGRTMLGKTLDAWFWIPTLRHYNALYVRTDRASHYAPAVEQFVGARRHPSFHFAPTNASTGPLHEAYRRRDRDTLLEALGINIWERLVREEEAQRPLLEEHGFRNLQWWDQPRPAQPPGETTHEEERHPEGRRPQVSVEA